MKLLILSDFLPNNSLKLSLSFEKLLEAADAILFNLEGSPLLKNETGNVPVQIMPFDVDELLSFVKKYDKHKFHIALANNHILDNGEDGFTYLVNQLNKNNINFFGTRDKPFTNIDGVAVLNLVTAETVAKRKIGNKNLNYLFYNTQQINKQIKELEASSDKLVFYPHWGRDMDTEVFKTFDQKLHFDKTWLVFGHHPHVISGVEKNRIYSMGNTYIPHPYYFDSYPATRYGLSILLDSDSMEYEILGTVLKKNGDDKYELFVSEFDGINEITQKHGQDFGYIKRLFLNVFSFKGNSMDRLKLNVLQLLTVIFSLKYKLLNKK